MLVRYTPASPQDSSPRQGWTATTRIVTFADGMVVREEIVAVDDAARRVVWAIVGQQFHHYNGAAQIFDHADGTRFVWTTDLLPDELAPNVDTMMTAGIAAIKKTIEGA